MNKNAWDVALFRAKYNSCPRRKEARQPFFEPLSALTLLSHCTCAIDVFLTHTERHQEVAVYHWDSDR